MKCKKFTLKEKTTTEQTFEAQFKALKKSAIEFNQMAQFFNKDLKRNFIGSIV